MKKHLFALGALAISAAALASGSVSGHGGFAQVKEGVATFRMEIDQQNLGEHYFIFASEGSHNDYPDTVFKSTSVTQYMEHGDNEVMVMGRGLLYHLIPVDYMARFVDGADGRRDFFELHAWNSRNGAHVIHLNEFITRGNIVVRHGK